MSENHEKYIRHLIECQCILKIYEKRTKPVYHKFPVFSTFNKEGEVEEKYVSCNNCNSIHRVYDVFKSEIMWGQDGIQGLVNSIEDIRFNLDSLGKEKLVEILTINKIEDISIWEQVEYLIENNLSDKIILEKNEIKDNIVLKILYVDKDIHKIKKESFQRFI